MNDEEEMDRKILMLIILLSIGEGLDGTGLENGYIHVDDILSTRHVEEVAAQV